MLFGTDCKLGGDECLFIEQKSLHTMRCADVQGILEDHISTLCLDNQINNVTHVGEE